MKVITQAQDLINHLQAEHEASLEDVLWFVAIQRARFISEACTLKDIAEMLLSGLPAMEPQPLQAIQDWLDESYADLNAAIEEGEVEIVNGEVADEFVEMYDVPDIVQFIDEHFNVKSAE
ncbi:hypothetical protein D3C75_224470 [compost metagenome]